MHLDQGAHERMGSFRNGSSVGLFRHEDESFNPYFIEFVTIYPGRYRVRTSLWSFQWDKGKVLPARGTEAARLSSCTLTGDGRGGGHPSTVLGYYDAPSLQEKVHDFVTWLNPNDIIGFNAASLAPRRQHPRQEPGDGLHRPRHRLRLPRHRRPAARRLAAAQPSTSCSAICRWSSSSRPTTPASGRRSASRSARRWARARIAPIRSRASGPSTASSRWSTPTACSASFLPRAFRRPVDAETRKAVRGPRRRAAEGRRLLRDGDALGLPRGPLLAGFPLPRRAGRQARRPRPGLPAVVLLLALDAGRAADPAGRRRQAARARRAATPRSSGC